jgi:hypothetical protein
VVSTQSTTRYWGHIFFFFFFFKKAIIVLLPSVKGARWFQKQKKVAKQTA